MNGDAFEVGHQGAAKPAARIATALGRLLRRWTEAIDAAPPCRHHRMGAWEMIASANAQAAIRVMQERSE